MSLPRRPGTGFVRLRSKNPPLMLGCLARCSLAGELLPRFQSRGVMMGGVCVWWVLRQ